MTGNELEEKAKRIQAVVEEKTLQVHGLLPMFVRATDFQLPTAQDYAGAAPHPRMLGKTEAELDMPPLHVWRAWEGTTAYTAYYLAAMAYQYRCTANPQALAICRRTLGALNYVYNLGVENGEPGFICKPYGGIYNKQTSTDKGFTVGLEAYQGIAPPEDRALIDEMIRNCADEHIKDGAMAKYGFLGYPRKELEFSTGKENWTSAFFYLPSLYLAWRATGDAKYLRQVQRWYDACDVSMRWPLPQGQTKGYFAFVNIYLPSLLMEMDPAHHELWRSRMLSVFRLSRPGLLPDGTSYVSWIHNPDTGQTTPTASGDVGVKPKPYEDILAKRGPVRTGRFVSFARAYVSAQRWFPDENMAELARVVLERLDMDTFRLILPVSDDRPLPKPWQAESQFLDLDCVTAWLWTYWEGRWRGYW